jgi:probable rRNA maturation factor
MAAPPYTVAWQVAPAEAGHVRRRALAALVRRALASEGVPGPVEMSIVMTDDETVRDLNHRYRGVDEATDVLSFGMEADDGFVTPPGIARHLGEIVISCETAARQAQEAGRDIDEELAHLVVHGVLHVLGYDHGEPEEAKTMRAKEEALLGRRPH